MAFPIVISGAALWIFPSRHELYWGTAGGNWFVVFFFCFMSCVDVHCTTKAMEGLTGALSINTYVCKKRFLSLITFLYINPVS